MQKRPIAVPSLLHATDELYVLIMVDQVVGVRAKIKTLCDRIQWMQRDQGLIRRKDD